jgi:hypothetical protein
MQDDDDNNNNRHSNYSPTSNKGHAIILILILEDLHHTAIWRGKVLE